SSTPKMKSGATRRPGRTARGLRANDQIMFPSHRVPVRAPYSPEMVKFDGFGSRLRPDRDPAAEQRTDPRHREVGRREVEDDEPRRRGDHERGRDPAEQEERPDDVSEHRPMAGG